MRKPLETDWERVDRMTDADIDLSDSPALDKNFLKHAKVRLPSGIVLDPEIYAWLRKQGGDVSERINEALRHYIATQEKAA
jgi:uncharacterized protein (DUF4415 family)